MAFFKQSAAVVSVGVRSLPQRYASSLVIVVGIAGVVAVLISVLALSTGLQSSLAMTGDDSRAIVLGKQVTSEVTSSLSREVVATILDAPGIRHGADGKPLASAEALATVNLPRKDNDTLSAITLRGVSLSMFTLRPELKIVEGRSFQRGVRELVVGRAAQSRVRDLELGKSVHIGDSDWKVVGVFDSGGAARDSELLTDVETMLSAYGRNTFNSVTVAVDAADGLKRLAAALGSNPTVSVDVERESDYYARQSRSFSGFLALIARIVASIMAIGAVFAALNTMYSAVASRTREIGTLRAIGFKPGAVVVSVMVEALLLAVTGALLGSALAWVLFDGHVVSTIAGGGSEAQVVFHLNISPALVVSGIIWACTVGAIGGLLPAIRAARQPLVTTLRAI